MFSFHKIEAMDVHIEGMDESVQLGVVKANADNKMYFRATKRNKQLQRILDKSMGDDRCYYRNRSCTTVLESIKKLRDAKYNDQLQQAPQQTRSKRFKAFVLRIPESVVIKAPAVGDVPSIDMRVLLGSLVYVKCVF
jgi:hypothetical protein